MKPKPHTPALSPTKHKRRTHKSELVAMVDRGYRHFWAKRMALAVMKGGAT